MAFESLRNCTFRAENGEILRKSDIYVRDNVSIFLIFIHIVGLSSFFNISWPSLRLTQPKGRFFQPPGWQERAPCTLSENPPMGTSFGARERSAAFHPKTPRPCRSEHAGDLRLEVSVKIARLPADTQSDSQSCLPPGKACANRREGGWPADAEKSDSSHFLLRTSPAGVAPGWFSAHEPQTW
jgi:hypothetical protein